MPEEPLPAQNSNYADSSSSPAAGDSRSPGALKSLTYAEGAAGGLVGVVGEGPLMLLLASLGFQGTKFGLLVTLPIAFAALMQGLVPKLLKNACARSMTMGAVVVQIVGIGILMRGVLATEASFALLLAGFLVYHTGGACAGSPWQLWVANLVPSPEQNGFFARRGAFLSLVFLAAHVLMGFILKVLEIVPSTVAGLLAVSLVLRIVSLALLWFHPTPSRNEEPKFREVPSHESSPVTLSLGALCTLIFMFRFSVNISQTFLQPFSVKALSGDALLLSFVGATPLLARVILLRNWGRMLDMSRVFESLVICMFGIAIVPLFWTLGSGSVALATSEFFAGFVWSGFDLVMSLFILRHFKNGVVEKQAFFMAAGGLGAVAGGLAGGALLDAGLSFHGLFGLSSVLRIVASFAFLRYLRQCGAFRFRELHYFDSMRTLLGRRLGTFLARTVRVP